jgi:hypothetical protein
MNILKPQREVIFEFHQVGGYIKVTAMDADTQEETSITGAATATRDYLQKLAYDKLMLTLRKKGIVK